MIGIAALVIGIVLGLEVSRLARNKEWLVEQANALPPEPYLMPITATFTGDASLRSRPMARVLEPLTQFGARFEGLGPKALMPVTVQGARDVEVRTRERIAMLRA